MNECHLKLKMLQLTKAPEALKSCQELWATPPPAEHLSLEVQGAPSSSLQRSPSARDGIGTICIDILLRIK